MKIYCDTEFTGLRKDTELISIGIIADDGRTFYAESNEYSLDNIHKDDKKWLSENVIPYLIYNDKREVFSYRTLHRIDDTKEYFMKGNKQQISVALKSWLLKYDDILFVGDVLAYDWVLFCDLLSERAVDIPKYISYTPIDIATLMYVKGIDPLEITRMEYVDTSDLNGEKIWQKQHNALYDAIIIKRIYYKLTNAIQNYNISINL